MSDFSKNAELLAWHHSEGPAFEVDSSGSVVSIGSAVDYVTVVDGFYAYAHMLQGRAEPSES
jgi:hypothetical protein